MTDGNETDHRHTVAGDLDVLAYGLAVADLVHHRDPFDRLLIAQAMTEGLVVVTADRRFAEYAVEVVYAG